MTALVEAPNVNLDLINADRADMFIIYVTDSNSVLVETSEKRIKYCKRCLFIFHKDCNELMFSEMHLCALSL